MAVDRCKNCVLIFSAPIFDCCWSTLYLKSLMVRSFVTLKTLLNPWRFAGYDWDSVVLAVEEKQENPCT